MSLLTSFGVSGWIRSRGLGIATTSLSLIGALAAFAALRPYLHVVSAFVTTPNQTMQQIAVHSITFTKWVRAKIVVALI